MVARLTPDQKVACSIHVGFKSPDPIPFCSLDLPPGTRSIGPTVHF
ncbi:unnamed protein product [Spirodela intermedia]|uniref:Uncharacterized protein n=1 Tax=Spirodela intermedia TaxID=51605 RepID=A0A7I8K3G5_SPIIN|nr:unnamed protein product [Spirodela intermedia]